MPDCLDLHLPIAKLIEDERIVIGWGYVCRDIANKIVSADRTTADGIVVDWSGEVVDIDDLEKAMYAYVEKSRKAERMHDGDSDGPVGTLVVHLTTSPSVKAALGLPDDFPEGTILGYRIDDDDTWEDLRTGKLKMLSLRGGARREAF